MFRESSFDPASRIRRGLLFQKFGTAGWEQVRVETHPASHTDVQQRMLNNGMRISKELSVYIECFELLRKPRRGEGMRIVSMVSFRAGDIGFFDQVTRWTVGRPHHAS
jgi:hypothetical protein